MFTFALPEVMTDIVLFLVRALLAFVFLYEARHKLRDIKDFAKKDNLALPLAYFVAIAEGAAGISMLTGVMAQWAGVGLVLLMLLTIRLHVFKWHSPYWAAKRGWEYDLILLVLAAVIVAFGAGSFALLS